MVQFPFSSRISASTDKDYTMEKRRLTRRVAATVGIAAAILAGALTACAWWREPSPLDHHDHHHHPVATRRRASTPPAATSSPHR